MNVLNFAKRKQTGQAITMATCYDFATAKIIESSDVDAVLVGDSAAMVVHGHPDTTTATVDMMVAHTAAVSKGLQQTFLVADLPFMSYRQSLETTMIAVTRLVQAGAQAVKLEGADPANYDSIRHIVNSGVPVMGHIGLTPQFLHGLGGFKVQGKTPDAQTHLLQQAKALEDAGCFAIVLECMPLDCGRHIRDALSIPTIGIGAGPHTDGQILVLTDLLGMQLDCNFKFAKPYLDGHGLVQGALNQYAREVATGIFPDSVKHSF